MGKKLSILQRSYDQTGWHKSSQFSTSDIKDIKVVTARNDKSLNAIPSPFARIHLFEAAFDLLDKDELNGTSYAGDTFKKIVSDCLDVFELIFNWNNHIRDGRQLNIVRWNREVEISNLKHGKSKHKLLGETFEVFFKEESFENYDDIYIIKYNNKPIAGTSPFTAFFTAPGLENVDLYNPLARGNYFSKIIPLSARKPEVIQFIKNFFANSQLGTSNSTRIIRAYLKRHFEDLAGDIHLPLEELSLPDHQRIHLFGTALNSSSRKSEIDYFEKCLIRLNYKINNELFVTPVEAQENRTYDYLLPLTPTFFQDYKIDDILKYVKIRELHKDSVEVSVQSGSTKISKQYHLNPKFSQDGTIIDLAEEYSVKLNIAIYPFVKIINSQHDFNDFYKVGLTIQDLKHRLSNKDFEIFFGKNGILLENTNIHSIRREDRTILSEKTAVGSSYFSLNTSFDFIQIKIQSLSDVTVAATIAPRWREKSVGNKKIDYSIDFGTTTSFIAFTDDPHYTKQPEPFNIKQHDVQVVTLNKPKVHRDGISWTECYGEKSIPDFPESVLTQNQELIPSIISNEKGEVYNFPIRTALFQKQSVEDNIKQLFGTTNIAFTYQRQENNLTYLNQEYITNLKWNIKTNDSYRTSIKIFLEELFYLLRTKTLLNDGDPQKSDITWFSPLSFTPAAKQAYSEIWQDLFSRIFKAPKTRVNNLTESEAPYYYLYKNASINDAKAVLTIDIGGGSSDMMFFSENQPVLGTSVHFGANVLWSNGFNDFTSDKSNGIYEAIKQKVSNNLKSTELKGYNDKVMNDYGSDEIINFWILNNDKSNVLDELKRTDFKLTYLLHLSSLIYHFACLLKANNRPAPTCIIFSGNGSRYIDLIQSRDSIGKISGYILKSVFGQATQPQVILPEENRKEATCYGGLYKPQLAREFKAVNYLGFENNLEQYKKYYDIDIKKDIVFENLLSSFRHFIDIFFDMTNEPGLSFRNNFGIEAKLQAIKTFILEKSAENLTMGFDKRRNSVSPDDDISDSLFFYPLVGLIYRINRMTPDEVKSYIPKTVYYGLSPDEENEFHINRLTPQKKDDSIFSITIQDDNPNIGELGIVEHPMVYQRAIGAIHTYLKPVSDWEEFPASPTQEIKVVKPGIVEKQGEKWIVKERLQLQFV